MTSLRRIVPFLLLGAVAATLWIGAQDSAPTPPFAGTPALDAIFFNNISVKGAVVLVRKIDGSYFPVRYMRSAPYLASDPVPLMDYLSAGVSNLLNVPAGPPGVSLSAGLVTAGKFTSGGDPGVASISLVRSRNTITVHRASLAGLYQGATPYTIGESVASVAAADFTGDGVADLAVSYEGNFGNVRGGIAILTNKGDGTFNAPALLTAGNIPTRLTVADLNRDNRPDIVVGDFSASNVYVFLGQSGGTFSAPAAYPVEGGSAAVITADFNGDGIADIAGGGTGRKLNVLLGNGDGTFRANRGFALSGRPETLAAGDFNGDSRPDVALVFPIAQTVAVFLNDGSGGFTQAAEYNTSYRPESLVLTDYNQDNKLDILIGQGDARVIGPEYNSQKIDVLLGRGDGSFAATQSLNGGGDGGRTGFVVSGDFNGDGREDAIVSDFSADRLYLMNGGANGELGRPSTIPLSNSPQSRTGPWAGVTGDFNGDGRPDVAYTQQHRTAVGILLNLNGTLQAPTSFPSGGTEPNGIAAGDFDGDGKLDLAVSHRAGQVTILRGGGNGAFQLANTYSTGALTAAITVGDLNGDGRPDLVVTNQGDEFSTPQIPASIHVLINNGSGFNAPAVHNPALFPVSSTIADVNGDGRLDVVTPATKTLGGFVIAVWLGNGNGTLQEPTTMTTDFGPTEVAARDFNLDGKVDLAVAHCCGSTDMTYFEGRGNGTFSPEVHFNGGASPQKLAVADIDKNGTPDLLVASGDSTALTVLLNTSAAGGTPKLDVVSGASYTIGGALAPLGIAVGFGTGLSAEGAVGTSPWPSTLVGTAVRVRDSLGVERTAPLVYVFPGQISFLIPAGTAPGGATIDVLRGGALAARGTASIADVAPGLITANSNGQGVAAAVAIRVSGGAQSSELIFTCAAAGSCTATPISLGGPDDIVVLTLYGTGIRGRSGLSRVTATAGGTGLEVQYAGAQNEFDGLDQVNVRLPRSLAGRGLLTLNLTVDGITANPVQFHVQ